MHTLIEAKPVATILSTPCLVQDFRSAIPEADDPQAAHILPVSGGADSCALAILLTQLFPQTNFHLIFTDTGDEDPGIYASLDRLERYIGRPIERIAAEKSLTELIAQFNGFLPSAKDRWCTRILKLEPFKQWLSRFSGYPRIKMYVGIRADEDRIAFVAPEVETVMPFVSLGFERAQVFRTLSETIGVPAFYRHRSRSGCGMCPFQRQTEIIGLLQNDPATFQRGRQLEKLSPTDQKAHADMPEPYWNTSGLARNWLWYPQPDWHQAPAKSHHPMPNLAKRQPLDMFKPERQGLWAAVEFWVHDSYLEPVTWWQSLVSVSTSRNGLQRQLDLHHQHRLSTAEAWGLSEEEMRQELRFVLYYLEVNADTLNVERPSKQSYTWQQGHSYLRTEHLTQWAQTALWSSQTGIPPKRHGKDVDIEVLSMERYQPKPPHTDDVFDTRFIACPVCTN